MKTNKVIGLVALTVGLAVLSVNFGWFNWSFDWSFVWNLWPTLLILLGLSFLLPRPLSGLLRLLAVIGLCVLVFVGIERLAEGWQRVQRGVSNQELRSSGQVPGRASFEFDSGAGDFSISGTSDDLVYAKTATTIGNYRLDESEEGDLRRTRLVMDSRGYFRLGRNQNKAEVSLSPDPVWDISVNIGAAAGSFDLSGHKVAKTTIKSGASSLELKLSDLLDESLAEIDAGASSVTILVPQTAAVELAAETGLASRELPAELKRVGDGTLYRTEGFDDAAKKIRLRVRAGVSSVRLERY